MKFLKLSSLMEFHYRFHKPHHVYIVIGVKTESENFVGIDKMPDISPRIVFANKTVTFTIKEKSRSCIFPLYHVYFAFRCQGGTSSCYMVGIAQSKVYTRLPFQESAGLANP